MTNYQVRQGDVFLERIDALPEGAEKQKDKKRIVLAWGEATGHAHAISVKHATRYQWKDDVLVEVHRDTHLVHEEHGAIALAPGVYKKTQQRSYTPQGIVNVRD